MRYRLWALLCLFWTAPALADSPSAQALLAEMASAQHDRDYSGRLVYMRGSELNTLEFLHAHFDGQEFERLRLAIGCIQAGRRWVSPSANASSKRWLKPSGTGTA